MVEITFIRHGETTGNANNIMVGRIDFELTSKGIEDAKNLKLDNIYNVFYCSPLIRTHQTLNAIFPNQAFIVDERITEVFTGDWQGKNKTEIPQDLYLSYVNGNYDPPNGETLKEVDERIISFLNDIFKQYKDNEKIFVVAHNGLMRNLRRLFYGIHNDNYQPKNLEMMVITKNQYESIIKGENI